VTYHEEARQLAAAIDQPVEYVDIPEVVARDAMLRAGLPEWTAEQQLILWNELRRGAAATTTDVVRVLTGRKPRTVADYARDHIAAFRS